MTRRKFIQTAPLAAAGLAKAQTAPRPLVIDTHVHCFAGAANKRFPYHQRAPYKPEVAATPNHLLKTMTSAGVDRATIVHPEPYQDDHRYLEYCLDLDKVKLKGTILCFADRTESMKQLPRLAKRDDIVAVRIHAFRPDRLPPFGKLELRQLWKIATDHGLAVQLHFRPRWCAGFEPLIREFKKTSVLIDHLGRPLQDISKEWERVIRWADLPNTHIKLSSLRNTPGARRAIQPFIDQLLKAYGPERLMWGGGYDASATGPSYHAAREYVRRLIGHLKPVSQAQIFGGNAAKLMGFK